MINNEKHCILYLVRHGETEWNKLGLVQGHTDLPLTPDGIRQAEELSDELRVVKFDAVFSSDLVRARRTAEIIALERALAVQTTELLRERSHGAYEGASWEKYLEAVRRYRDTAEGLPESVESDESVVGRLITFLREVSVAHAGKTVLMVSHGGMMRQFLIHLGYAKPSELQRNSIKNAAYLMIDCDGIEFFVKEVSGIAKSAAPSVE